VALRLSVAGITVGENYRQVETTETTFFRVLKVLTNK